MMKVMHDEKGIQISIAEVWASQASLFFSHLLRVSERDGNEERIPFAQITQEIGGLAARGKSKSFEVESEWIEMRGACTYWQVNLKVTNKSSSSRKSSLRFGCEVTGSGRPSWMIPGAFYKENRFKHNFRKYPRYDFEGGSSEEMVSDYWSFRADRAALPAIFVWNDHLCGALCVDEGSTTGINGLGFKGNWEGTAIWVDFPYREEPVTFIGHAEPAPADLTYYHFKPNETVKLQLKIYVSSSDPHAYNPFVRQMYELHKEKFGLNPWMGLEEAAELTAHGLYTWHYHPEHHILYETAAFDRELNNNVKGLGDRPHMHVGWVSGAPYAYALLKYGRQKDFEQYKEAGLRVMDKIASGLAPNGTFWASWIVDKGWGTGWNPKKQWLQARTISEATLFMIRALKMDRERGIHHPEWEKAVLSNLHFAVNRQRQDGNYGSYYHFETGEVEELDGAGGMLWIAALLEGGDYFTEPVFRASAIRAGDYYKKFIRDEYIYGAPEDVHLTPTSEDAYNAVVSYVLLYEHDSGSEQEQAALWLELACSAADWMMTYRWTYNIEFPKHTFLEQYDYRSRGADQASTSNQHLHNYGLFCVPEMLRLWNYTGDRYYLDRTKDNIACFLQFIARADGDFNAYKGMVTERFYNTNCFQPKGMMLTLSHSWCIGLVLYAAQEAMPYEALLDLNIGC